MNEQSDVTQLLAAYRRVAGPDAEGSARAWEGLARRAHAGEVVALEPEPEPIATSRWPVGWMLGAAAAAVLVAAASYAVGAKATREDPAGVPEQAVHRSQGAPDEHTTAVPRISAPVAFERAAVLPSSPIPPVVAELTAPADKPARPRRSKPVLESKEPAAAVPEEASIDAADVAALRAAQRLLHRDPAEALAALDRHAKDHPRSSFAAERSVGRITALCGLGRVADARTAAEAFAKAQPGSPLLARVRSTCADPTNSQTDPRRRSME